MTRILANCLAGSKLTRGLFLKSAAVALASAFAVDTVHAQAGPAQARTTAPAVAAPGGSVSVASKASSTGAKPRKPKLSEMKVMAVVNAETVSREQLAKECLRRYGEEVLENLINKRLILTACERAGVVVTEQDVHDEVDHIAKRFGLSRERYLQMLEVERDIPPSKYMNEIVWPMLALRKVAANQIEISPQEIAEQMETEFGPKVRVQMISGKDPQKLAQLREQAVANPDEFGTLAKDYSEDRTSASGRGWIPPIRKHMGDAEIERVVFGLKEGEISPVVSAAGQHFIFKCVQHEGPVFLPEEHKAHAEGQILEQLRDRKMRDVAADLFAKLQNESEIKNVYNDESLRQSMPGVAATVNGVPVTIEQLSNECLERHCSDVLTGEIHRLILEQEMRKRGSKVEEADLDEEIARAAELYGYSKPDGTPDIDAWLKYVTKDDASTIELYVRDAVWPSVALKKLVDSEVVVTEEDLQKGFEANFGQRVEALAIVCTNQRQAAKCWEMARQNPTDEFFGELAYQYSVEPVSRANRGRIPPIQKFGGRPELETEAFRLQTGELSGVIAVGDKFIVLRCTGRTEPVVTEFASVRDELYKDIHEKKLRLEMEKTFDRLKESSQIDNFLEGTSQSGVRQASAELPVGGDLRARLPVAPR